MLLGQHPLGWATGHRAIASRLAMRKPCETYVKTERNTLVAPLESLFPNLGLFGGDVVMSLGWLWDGLWVFGDELWMRWDDVGGGSLI